MKTIVVATDFSPSAVNAACYAADMALAINAKLLLLYVYQLPVTYNEIPVPMTETDITEFAEQKLYDLKEQLSARTGGKLQIDVEVRIGFFFRQELKAVCQQVNPFAVVMGTQGTTAGKHFLFGSHTLYAMKHLMWPLIAVPPGFTFSNVKKIGLALDFHKVMETAAIGEVIAMVNDFNAELHVINTGKKLLSDQDIAFESALLEHMLGTIKPEYHFITSEYTDEAIMNFAENNNIDLLIMLPGRYNLPETLVHKSHTKQMVLHCHVPVMALRQRFSKIG